MLGVWHTMMPVMDGCVLAVSPHLDDAVLSAGATLAALVEAGVPVINCTVFAGDPPGPLTPAAARFHTECGLAADAVGQRRAEDSAAAAVLGLRTLHLPFPDAVYRLVRGRPLCHEPGALFTSDPEDDPDLVAAVAAALAAVLAQTAPAMVLTCAGIGQHVDHRLVRAAVEHTARRAETPVGHWADLPYAIRSAEAVPPGQPLPVPAAGRHLTAKLRAVAQYRSQLRVLWRDADWATDLGGHAQQRLDRGWQPEDVRAAAGRWPSR
jgi:LmbE family N-acetylglucosaminyl deacetylase